MKRGKQGKQKYKIYSLMRKRIPGNFMLEAYAEGDESPDI